MYIQKHKKAFIGQQLYEQSNYDNTEANSTSSKSKK